MVYSCRRRFTPHHLVGEKILRSTQNDDLCVQNDSLPVILREERPKDLRILHYVQNDMMSSE